MSLQNPNTVGEIRYTLDNSIPTAASPLYRAPIEIARGVAADPAIDHADARKERTPLAKLREAVTEHHEIGFLGCHCGEHRTSDPEEEFSNLKRAGLFDRL